MQSIVSAIGHGIRIHGVQESGLLILCIPNFRVGQTVNKKGCHLKGTRSLSRLLRQVATVELLLTHTPPSQL